MGAGVCNPLLTHIFQISTDIYVHMAFPLHSPLTNLVTTKCCANHLSNKRLILDFQIWQSFEVNFGFLATVFFDQVYGSNYFVNKPYEYCIPAIASEWRYMIAP